MPKMLVVDDDHNIHKQIQGYFPNYQISSATNTEEAIKLLNQNPFAISLIDIYLDKSSGIDLLKYIQTNQIPIDTIMLSATTKPHDVIQSQRFGARDFIAKPLNKSGINYLKKKIQMILEEQSAELSNCCKQCLHRQALHYRLDEAHEETIHILASAAEAKDDDTGNHIYRIKAISTEITLAMKLQPSYADLIGISSILHDVGKIQIPDHILKKEGPLSQEEWKIMKLHPIYGEQILRYHPFYETARQIARHHHENWDGSGYPDKLQGEVIPLPARIVAIADVWDALTHRRCYKEVWSEKKTLIELDKLSGSKFDPEIVQIFFDLYVSGRIQAVTKNLN